MPIANGFLTADKFDREYFFDLSVASCPACGMFQLVEQPQREMMFNDHYAFFSGTSKGMADHFEQFAQHVITDYLPETRSFVVEIGSNDGILLKHFAQANIAHLGIEPSSNVADVARARGISIWPRFFDEECARDIVREKGQADAFLAANVMCHIPRLHCVVEGIRILLKPTGIVMLEDPYLGDVIQNTSYDQIYDEHVFLFSLQAIQYLFGQHGMEVVDLEHQLTHGGSMRYVIANKGARSISERVIRQQHREEEMGLRKSETYEQFRRNCERSRIQLLNLLDTFRAQGKRIVGYAATSKSTTIINYCGITSDHIDFISDTTPIKQGKYSPGAHIPVKSHNDFIAQYPDYALLFAYNHANEIMRKEQQFIESGGKWILYVPQISIV